MVALTIETISSLCVSRVTLKYMHSKETVGVMTEPIPIRVGGVEISIAVPIGERRGGLVCKIAKWMTGVRCPRFFMEVQLRNVNR